MEQQSTSTLSESELAAFEEFRSEFDPEKQYTDRSLVRFFFLAKGNTKDATEYARKFYTIWNEEKEKADDKTVLEEIKTKKMTFGGFDSEGRRIVHFHYHMHDPKQFPLASTMKLFFMLMDIALDSRETAENGMVFICWMRNSGWSNFDLASEKYFTESITALSPMSLNMMNQMIMVDSPWYVWAAMKLCAPFITKEIKEKLFMLSEAELRAKFPKEALTENDLFLTSVTAPEYVPWE